MSNTTNSVLTRAQRRRAEALQIARETLANRAVFGSTLVPAWATTSALRELAEYVLAGSCALKMASNNAHELADAALRLATERVPDNPPTERPDSIDVAENFARELDAE